MLKRIKNVDMGVDPLGRHDQSERMKQKTTDMIEESGPGGADVNGKTRRCGENKHVSAIERQRLTRPFLSLLHRVVMVFQSL